MPLTESQKHHLRRLAHGLRPVVIVGGAGLSEAVIAETEAALKRHELIKVRVNAPDRDTRAAMIAEIAGRTKAELVQTIGHVAVYYRAAKKPGIALPA